MDFERLLDQLRQDEGFSKTPYKDTLGRYTIGYGSTYICGHRVTASTPPISIQVALTTLMADAYSACINARGLYKNFDGLHPVRQEVLVNMAYNLGGRGLAGFVRMKAAIEKGEFILAALEMKDSIWYQQVGHRSERLRNLMISPWNVDKPHLLVV